MKLYELILLITTDEEELIDIPVLQTLHLFLLGEHDDFWKEILNLSLYDWHDTYRSDIRPGQWRNFAIYVNSQIPPICQRVITCHSDCLEHARSDLYRVVFPDELYGELGLRKGYFRPRNYFLLPPRNELWPLDDADHFELPKSAYESVVSSKYRIMPCVYYPDVGETFASVLGPYPERETYGAYIELAINRIVYSKKTEEIADLDDIGVDKDCVLDKCMTLVSNDQESVIRYAFDDILYRIEHFESFAEMKTKLFSYTAPFSLPEKEAPFVEVVKTKLTDEKFIKNPLLKPNYGDLFRRLVIKVPKNGGDETYEIVFSLRVFRFD